MCSVTSPPRISFSYDVGPDDDDDDQEVLLIDQKPRRDMSLLDSSSEFEFSICRSCLEQEGSLADDLFAGGMILPVSIQDTTGPVPAAPSSSTPALYQVNRFNLYKGRPGSSLPLLPPLSTNGSTPARDQREAVFVNCDQVEDKQQQQPAAAQASSKSFWGFKRSSSLNCDVRKSLIWSLPLLSRSNSTGSVPKAAGTTKDNHKRGGSNPNRQQPDPNGKPASSKSSYVYSPPQHKPPLKKGYSGAHANNGVRISPVLNVPPPPYITKGTASFLGFGSFLRTTKEKKSRK